LLLLMLMLLLLLVMLRVGGGHVRLEMCAATRAGCGVLCGVLLENQQKKIPAVFPGNGCCGPSAFASLPVTPIELIELKQPLRACSTTREEVAEAPAQRLLEAWHRACAHAQLEEAYMQCAGSLDGWRTQAAAVRSLKNANCVCRRTRLGLTGFLSRQRGGAGVRQHQQKAQRKQRGPGDVQGAGWPACRRVCSHLCCARAVIEESVHEAAQ
jgi:hypothetical protein